MYHHHHLMISVQRWYLSIDIKYCTNSSNIVQRLICHSELALPWHKLGYKVT